MRLRTLAAISAFLVLPSVTASAQTAARNGVLADSLKLDAAAIRTGVIHYRVHLLEPNGLVRPMGSLVEEVKAVEHQGRPALLRATSIVNPMGMITDTSLVLRETLAPVWFRSHRMGQKVAVDFEGARVKVAVEDTARHETTRLLEAPAFDSNTLELLLGALPLGQTFQATLPMWLQEQAEFRRVVVFDGGDRVPGWLSTTRPVLKVFVPLPNAMASYWIDQETRRMAAAEFGMVDGRALRITRAPGNP